MLFQVFGDLPGVGYLLCHPLRKGLNADKGQVRVEEAQGRAEVVEAYPGDKGHFWQNIVNTSIY
jgi:hypothetical protein